MKLLREIKALRRMHTYNGSAGDICRFINVCSGEMYLDVYELVVSCAGKRALKRQFIWEYNPNVVDVWEFMKYRVPLSDRASFHFAYGFLRGLVSRLLRDSKRYGVEEACRRWVGLDVRFLLSVSERTGWQHFCRRQLVWR
ncbi:hypothetical protein GTGU_04697 [Trabulsiella guamensis ATCC 49490]|uniref:Uncharacterized protein n=1 Tax=Trabulsiella guamensis ATCC 49490 TaxID=1005994 RepID=A0A084ZD51_9ENTR|nr:hypothetical protein [Trabulsiella guamensis]KFB95395.1 hypothetical protein GTGU_04697 [Trabulsiella guamensis ATCC 49490]